VNRKEKKKKKDNFLNDKAESVGVNREESRDREGFGTLGNLYYDV